jgi:hypothetical protein
VILARSSTADLAMCVFCSALCDGLRVQPMIACLVQGTPSWLNTQPGVVSLIRGGAATTIKLRPYPQPYPARCPGVHTAPFGKQPADVRGHGPRGGHLPQGEGPMAACSTFTYAVIVTFQVPLWCKPWSALCAVLEQLVCCISP